MTVNRAIPAKLIYCADCKSRESWERYPDKDMKTENGNIFEFGYKCRKCGAVTLSPAEAILKISEVVKCATN